MPTRCRAGLPRVPRPILDTLRIKPYIQIVASVRGPMPDKEELYFISMAARLLGMHPQTLRKYERLGLVQPTRVIGSVRVYSREEIARLRLIKHLVDEVGINLAGVHRLLLIAEALERLRPMVCEQSLTDDLGRRRLARAITRLAQMLEG
jgi:MerR family transcriptional regulator/heat shock protein HspR